jgi:hypothetical protein
VSFFYTESGSGSCLWSGNGSQTLHLRFWTGSIDEILLKDLDLGVADPVTGSVAFLI